MINATLLTTMMILSAEPELVRGSDGTSAVRYKASSGDEVPAGFHLVSEPNLGAIIPGATIFALAYVPWALIGTSAGSPENLVPVFGPLIAYRERTGLLGTVVSGFSLVLIGFDVAMQAAGLITLMVGLATPRRWLEREVKGPSISLAPGAPGSELGASVVGRF